MSNKNQGLPVRNPLTHRAHRRQVLWQILLPLAIGVIAMLVFTVLAATAQAGKASLWADISIIFLIIPLMAVCLLFLALTAGLIYLFMRLSGLIPSYARQAQDFILRLGQRVRRGADASSEPLLRYHSFVAALRALRRRKPAAG